MSRFGYNDMHESGYVQSKVNKTVECEGFTDNDWFRPTNADQQKKLNAAEGIQVSCFYGSSFKSCYPTPTQEVAFSNNTELPPRDCGFETKCNKKDSGRRELIANNKEYPRFPDLRYRQDEEEIKHVSFPSIWMKERLDSTKDFQSAETQHRNTSKHSSDCNKQSKDLPFEKNVPRNVSKLETEAWAEFDELNVVCASPSTSSLNLTDDSSNFYAYDEDFGPVYIIQEEEADKNNLKTNDTSTDLENNCKSLTEKQSHDAHNYISTFDENTTPKPSEKGFKALFFDSSFSYKGFENSTSTFPTSEFIQKPERPLATNVSSYVTEMTECPASQCTSSCCTTPVAVKVGYQPALGMNCQNGNRQEIVTDPNLEMRLEKSEDGLKIKVKKGLVFGELDRTKEFRLARSLTSDSFEISQTCLEYESMKDDLGFERTDQMLIDYEEYNETRMPQSLQSLFKI